MDEQDSSHFQTMYELNNEVLLTHSLLVHPHANGDWYAKTPLGWVNLETSSVWFKTQTAAQAALTAQLNPDGSEL